MDETDPIYNAINQQARSIKRFKLVTAVTALTLVVSITVVSTFLVLQKKEHCDLMQKRDEKESELHENLKQMEEERAEEKQKHDDEKRSLVQEKQDSDAAHQAEKHQLQRYLDHQIEATKREENKADEYLTILQESRRSNLQKESRIEDLERQLLELDKTNTACRQENTRLQQAVDEQKKKVDELGDYVLMILKHREECIEDLARKAEEILELKKEFDALTVKVDELEAKKLELEQETRVANDGLDEAHNRIQKMLDSEQQP